VTAASDPAVLESFEQRRKVAEDRAERKLRVDEQLA